MRVTDLEVDNIIQQEHRTSTGAWLPRGMCVNWNELRYLIVLSLRYGEHLWLNIGGTETVRKGYNRLFK